MNNLQSSDSGEPELEEVSVHSSSINQSNTVTSANVNTTGNADDTGISIADNGNRVGARPDAATGVHIRASSDPGLSHCTGTVADPVKQQENPHSSGTNTLRLRRYGRG